jgi:hypothetical protein
MAITTGSVNCVQVADDYGFFALRETGTGTQEVFVLWFFPDESTAISRILQSTWVSLLREARAGNIPVSVAHDDGSAEVRSLQLGLF